MSNLQNHAFSLKNSAGLYYSLIGTELTTTDAPNEFERQPTNIKDDAGGPATMVFFGPGQFGILSAILNKYGYLTDCIYHCGNEAYKLNPAGASFHYANFSAVIKSIK